jgi:hypothetical protein
MMSRPLHVGPACRQDAPPAGPLSLQRFSCNVVKHSGRNQSLHCCHKPTSAATVAVPATVLAKGCNGLAGVLGAPTMCTNGLPWLEPVGAETPHYTDCNICWPLPNI